MLSNTFSLAYFLILIRGHAFFFGPKVIQPARSVVALKSVPISPDNEESPERSDENSMDDILIELSFASYAQSFDAQKEMERMKLAWDIRETAETCDVELSDEVVRDTSACADACPACQGTGSVLCRFCSGTGFFIIGDDLIGQSNDCPVCGGKGGERCVPCQGTGAVAVWGPPKIKAD